MNALVSGAAMLLGLSAIWIGPTAHASAAGSDVQEARWTELRKGLFGDRSIHDDPGGIIRLEIPSGPDNAAVVPTSVKASIPQTPERYVKSLFIVIDNNPEPLAAVFHLTPLSGLASLATNLRVQTHSYVRAIAEMDNGELFMSSQFVKATGGCSGTSSQAIAGNSGNAGQVLIRAQSDNAGSQPHWAQIIILHPNHTGLQVDPIKGHPISAHFVKHLRVSHGDAEILTAETGISISEDPTFRFYYLPQSSGALKVEVTDSRGFTFRQSIQFSPREVKP